MLDDPSFVRVLLIGVLAFNTMAVAACGLLILWMCVLLSRIERNQREGRPLT